MARQRVRFLAEGVDAPVLEGELWLPDTEAPIAGVVVAHPHPLRGGSMDSNVVVALCGPCTPISHGTAKLSKAVMKDASKHLLYVNVHTAKNPAGEIRGQVAP